MSMKIPQDRIDSGDLSPEEIYYLQTRGRLPNHIAPVAPDGSGNLIPSSPLYVPVAELKVEELEKLLAQKQAERDAQQPSMGDRGGIVEQYDDEIDNERVAQAVQEMLKFDTEQDKSEYVEDNPGPDEEAEGLEEPLPEDPAVDEYTEDYDEGWSNQQRRTELARRKLSVDGNKVVLIDRLLRSDRGEITKEDSPPAM